MVLSGEQALLNRCETAGELISMPDLVGLTTGRYVYTADNGTSWAFTAVTQIARQAGFVLASSIIKPVEQAPFKPRKLRLQGSGGVVEIIVPTLSNPLWVRPVEMNLDGVLYTRWLQFPEMPSSASVLQVTFSPVPPVPVASTPQKPSSGKFVYTDDRGRLWAYNEFNIVADQLGLTPAWAGIPLLNQSNFQPRKIKYVDASRGFVLYLIAPVRNGVVWATPPVVGLSGYLYTPTTKYAELPSQGFLTG